MPATIDIEPNVYVQVAMGFNRTPYTLPELVERWSRKVESIGLREYYGVEAWDWGLPGRMRGSQTAYHRKWIPYYVERKMNAINAETNANWGAQTIGLYVAARLMWDPTEDVDKLISRYFEDCFGAAAGPMRRLHDRFGSATPLRSATILPMLRDLEEAYAGEQNVAVRQRVIDMMSYLHYVCMFRDFELVRAAQPSRNDAYYEALAPLMEYAWRTRLRGMVHYYALARRLCNGLPKRDKRLDFYIARRDPPPIWKKGEQLTDDEVLELFRADLVRLAQDRDPRVVYSRHLEPVAPPGVDAGPSRKLGQDDEGIAHFRGGLTGYLMPAGECTLVVKLRSLGRSSTFTVYARRETVLFQQEVARAETMTELKIAMPRANEYRVSISGDFLLQLAPDVPFVYEASLAHPAKVEYSGPHYFYVPRGARELIFDCNGRLSLFVPGAKARRDFTAADRVAGGEYIVLDIPKEAAGRLWHTSSQTRGTFRLLNVPPLLRLHPKPAIVPREVAEADGLTTAP